MQAIKLITLTCSIAVLSSCIGTDEVEDTLISIEIEVPSDVTFVNGSFAKLVGQSAQLEALGTSDLGGTFVMTKTSWQSDNNSVVTIDDTGLVTAVGIGTARIVASNLGVMSETISVNVTDDADAIALVAITSENDASVVEPESTLQLSATALTAGGNEVGGVTFTWTSSDESIATVDGSGLVTTVSEGLVRIIASTEGLDGIFELQVGSAESLSRTAALRGLNGYTVSGMAALQAANTGDLTLQLSEDFRVQNGPGLYLYLSNNRSNVSGGVEIAALRSNQGADVYTVPRTVDLEDFNHVLVYCKPFGVGFGTGELD